MYILKDRNMTARRQCRCMLCGGTIKKGEEYNRTTVVNDGDIYDCICHEHCVSLMSLLEMYDSGDYIYEDTFIDYVRQYVIDNHPDWDYKNIAECARKIYEELETVN